MMVKDQSCATCYFERNGRCCRRSSPGNWTFLFNMPISAVNPTVPHITGNIGGMSVTLQGVNNIGAQSTTWTGSVTFQQPYVSPDEWCGEYMAKEMGLASQSDTAERT